MLQLETYVAWLTDYFLVTLTRSSSHWVEKYSMFTVQVLGRCFYNMVSKRVDGSFDES